MPRDCSGASAAEDIFALDGCTAWLHRPPVGAALNHGVVLCNPLSAACVTTHRHWRHFARELAQAGFPTLRFDYPGTGDSADPPGGELLASWAASIGTAITWLRRHTEVTSVTLCGLRFGALLAAEAAAANPGIVTRLALLAPPASGRAYLRELHIGALTRNLPAIGGTMLEVDGLTLTAPDLAAMRRLDLAQALQTARLSHVLELHPAWQGTADPALARAAREAGAAFTQLGFPGFRDFMKPAYKSLVPEDSFQEIINWLNAPAYPPAADVRLPGLPARLALPGGLEEEAYRFDSDGGLFGILCRPTRPTAATAALIVNTGAEPHTGHCRFSVLLSRRLAMLGMPSFRIDVTGLGDSGRQALPILLPPGADQADYSEDQLARLRCFHPEFMDDVSTASAELERRGFARHIVIGICSGANLAIYAAQRDKNVAGIILINPNLSIRGEIPYPEPPKHLARKRPPARAVVRRCLDAMGFDEPRRNRFRWNWRVLRKDAACWLAMLTGSPALLDEKARWFWTLRHRPLSTLAIFSVSDEALPDWRLHAATLWRQAGAARRGVPRIVGNSHSFEPIAMRDELIDVISDHVLKTHLRPVPAQAAAPIRAGSA